jgi:hypothetical protein
VTQGALTVMGMIFLGIGRKEKKIRFAGVDNCILHGMIVRNH